MPPPPTCLCRTVRQAFGSSTSEWAFSTPVGAGRVSACVLLGGWVADGTSMMIAVQGGELSRSGVCRRLGALGGATPAGAITRLHTPLLLCVLRAHCAKRANTAAITGNHTAAPPPPGAPPPPRRPPFAAPHICTCREVHGPVPRCLRL